MKTNTNSRKKKLLALFLSLLMGTSTMAAFASCTDDSSSSIDSSDSSTEEETDEEDLVITNGDFETFDDKDGLNPIVTSVTGWTRSVNSATSGTALSSKAASGIIDTADKAWKDLTETELKDTNPSALTEEQAESLWDTMSTRDKLEYYAAWKKANSDGKIAEDLSFYESFNIDDEDLPLNVSEAGEKTPIANPRTHDYEAGKEIVEDEYGKTHTKVLMLHNEYSNSSYSDLGTAQKFSSSTTVTVNAGTSAKFSVWVKTSDLTCTTTAGEVENDIVDKGAYISISHSVGGTSLDPLTIKNIDTEKLNATGENNGWVQYEFMLKGSSYADTTFSIVLGLGLGGGTDRYEYVNGYAFFDDATCTIIQNSEYSEAGAETVVDFDTKKDAKVLKANEVGKKFAFDFSGDFDAASSFLDDVDENNKWTVAPTTQNGYSSAKGADKVWPALKGGFDTSADVAAIVDGGVKAALDGSDKAYAQEFYDEYYKSENKVNGVDLTTQKSVVLYSAWGAAYTAKSPVITIPAAENEDEGTYLAYSFYVKTSEMNGFTGAGVTVIDSASKTSISSIDTTTATPVTIVIDGKETDIHDGWQQCFLFLSNETDEDVKVQISLTFGTTTIEDTDRSAYSKGSAVFTGFAQKSMTEEEFGYATSGTYSKVIDLVGADTSAAGDSGFDSATNLSSKNIEDGYANPQNYKGVYSDSTYVTDAGANFVSNTYANAGLLNREHAENYADIFTKLGATGDTADEKWVSVFGDNATNIVATQPLVIYNDGSEAHDKAYGFIGSETTISANTYKAVSVRVKTNATAYVYLVDMSGDSNTDLLSMGRTRTYWYDEKGNVLTSYTNANGEVLTPDDEDFVTRLGTALKLQANGLYKINEAWAGAASLTQEQKNAQYANLAAYEEKDFAGVTHLMIADGGVSYDYNDNWKHDGNDQIAFYNYNKETKSAFAYSNNTTPVYDFSTISTLSARFAEIEGENEKDMFFEVTDTHGEWATVTFYIHTGENAKNYRLEVWSGARNATTANAANTYAFFDASGVSDPADADAYNKLLNFDERKEKLEEGKDYFEGIFSFYDSAKYLRYDADLDENGVGNKYDESYVAPTETSVAYLKDGYKIFADYATIETTVDAEPEEDDTTTDTEEEEDGEPTNVWLLASSIAIAAVLVLAVISLIVRKAVAKARKNRGAKAVVKSAKPKKEKKAKKDE
ncbi:MAG: hypothetical protein IJX91_03900 [Clostridia bacterium]|nr:hypothetical protein [Clostridia bacterium]